MIDLHSHILPGVDDGAPDWDTSLAMLQMAADDGITTIAATPHDTGWTGPKPAHQHLEALVIELESRARQAGIPIRIVPGMEVYLDMEAVDRVRQGTSLTLNRTRAVLVELPFSMWPPYTADALFQLQVAGYRPILAHAERYSAVQGKPELVSELAERGVLVQITSTSLTGLFGPAVKTLAEQLITARVAHLLASDAHTTRGRSPKLAAARDLTADLVGDEVATWMVETVPQAILDGADLALPAPLPIKRKRAKIFGLF
jgi:protein-tyrosine phosphatase